MLGSKRGSENKTFLRRLKTLGAVTGILVTMGVGPSLAYYPYHHPYHSPPVIIVPGHPHYYHPHPHPGCYTTMASTVPSDTADSSRTV